jgi:hypothetical protein
LVCSPRCAEDKAGFDSKLLLQAIGYPFPQEFFKHLCGGGRHHKLFLVAELPVFFYILKKAIAILEASYA